MTLICPQCGGNQLQNIRMIYEGGVNRSSTSGYTFATDGSNSSVGTFQGTKTSTSALAQRFAPPDTGRVERLQKAMKESWLYGTIGLLIFAFFVMVGLSDQDGGIGIVIGLLGCLVFAGVIGYGFYEKSKIDEATQQDYHAGIKLQEWANTIVCHTCSHQFVNENQVSKSKSMDSFQDYIKSGK